MITSGVDGAKQGWVYALVEKRRIVELSVINKFRFLGYPTLVDIPIGLPDEGERICDRLARKMLSKRASCVFSVPCRDAVYQNTYEKALETNRRYQKKGFSIQFWNIVEKVREVDRFLRQKPTLTAFIRESHPELCFMSFAGRPLGSKHKREGIAERLKILSAYLENMDVIKQCRRDVPIDDVLDALILAISLQFPLKTIPETPPKDRFGLPMEIVLPLV
ncbi:MAG: hypothetical protein PWP09_1555 [Thermotogota bacterium]|nr:hypothetical protein [Thermotogota bacterium]